ncbi:putative non-specific serine/threonine protein kinase [Helianthus annuus]|nr:putative non-specific serine/threonine protein kinase [Helianthus annuus]
MSLIDLSSNFLTGSIPECLQYITGPSYQAFMRTSQLWFSRTSFYYESVLNRQFTMQDEFHMFEVQDEVLFTTKTLSLTYKGDVLDIMSGIDLSCNKLTGDIPEGLGLLTQIHVLNLSHNMLTGPIPVKFSNLTNIESLDLSYNNLVGKVPSELVKLNSLSTFDVSFNNLSGRLPEMSAQFSTFSKESYEGNPLLCGPPLENKCMTGTHGIHPSNEEEESDDKWYDIDMGSFNPCFGSTWFVVMLGFLAVLYVNPYWRRAWLNFIEECTYTCYYFLYDLVRKVKLIFCK